MLMNPKTNSKNKKPKVIAIPSDLFACGLYRIKEPFALLQTKNEELEIDFEYYDPTTDWSNVSTLTSLTARLSSYDAIILQRPTSKELLAVCLFLKRQGKKFYVEVDDNLLNVSPTSPAYSAWRKGTPQMIVFIEALKEADCIITSTPELIRAYSAYNKRFVTFSNGLVVNDPKYSPKNNRRKELPEDKVVVMWTGSTTHYDSLLEINNSIKPVFDSHPNAVFALCSNKEFLDLFPLNPEQKIYIPNVGIEEYYNIPSMCDIALTPVKINLFNECKSELKCLEHGVWGVPTVSTNIAPYKRFNKKSDGANLLVENNRPKYWQRSIAKLIDDVNLRKELGEKTRKAVVEKYNTELINQQRYEFFLQELK